MREIPLQSFNKYLYTQAITISMKDLLSSALNEGDISEQQKGDLIKAIDKKSTHVTISVQANWPRNDDLFIVEFSDSVVKANESVFMRDYSHEMRPVTSIFTSGQASYNKYDFKLSFLRLGKKQIGDIWITDYKKPQISEDKCVFSVALKEYDLGSYAIVSFTIRYNVVLITPNTKYCRFMSKDEYYELFQKVNPTAQESPQNTYNARLKSTRNETNNCWDIYITDTVPDGIKDAYEIKQGYQLHNKSIVSYKTERRPEYCVPFTVVENKATKAIKNKIDGSTWKTAPNEYIIRSTVKHELEISYRPCDVIKLVDPSPIDTQ